MAFTEHSPRERAHAESARRGRGAFVAGCAALLAGHEADGPLVLALGGAHAHLLLSRDIPDDQAYWLRVWAARGLLWVFDDAAQPAIGQALGDPAWRVREMAVKVVARHGLGDLTAAVSVLRADPVVRVSAAARRALAVLTRTRA